MILNKSLLAACLLAFAGTTAVTTGVVAEDLVMGVRAGPDSIDPHWSTLATQVESLRHVFDTLIATDKDLQLTPGLAVSWTPITDTTWEFKIREGVKFHDGSDLTAEDVKFSIDRVPLVTGPMSMTIYTKSVESVEVIDDYTVHVHTKGPAATLPNDFIRLFVVSSEIGDVANEDFNSGKAAIGTGPFKFVSWEPKGDLVLEKNDGYWGEVSAWDKVVRKEIPNDASRVAALQSGEVDLINFLPATDYAVMVNDNRIDTFKADSVYIFNITPNVKDTLPIKAKVNGVEIDANPLQDLRVRTALDLAINRDILSEVVLEGLARPANQLMPASFFGGSYELPEREYDVDAAKALLAEAGYPNGFELEFTCTNNRMPGDAAVCEAIAQMWARAGLTIKANALNGTVFFPAQQAEELSLWMSAWGTLTGEASYTYGSLVHSNAPEKGLGAFNKSGYIDAELDAWLEEGAVTLDDDKRRALYEKVTVKSMNERVLIPTVINQTVWAAKAGKVTFEPRVDQEILAHQVHPAGQ